tara:strand:+ start:594 stop:833 length:240 start_codon:yes stop_codon:yes gene_type:complete
MENADEFISRFDRIDAHLEVQRLAIAVVAQHLPNKSAALNEFDEAVLSMYPQAKKDGRKDKYLEYLEEQATHMRRFLVG